MNNTFKDIVQWDSDELVELIKFMYNEYIKKQGISFEEILDEFM